MAMLEATGLSKSFETGFNLRECSLKIDPKAFVSIVGPNGSGKTTLLRLLTGSLRATSGSVSIDNKTLDSWEPRALARYLAVVGQRIEMEFPFTAGQVALLGRTPYLGGVAFERPADVEIALEAMKETGVDHLADRLFPSLSGGEQQRVIIAQALAQRPQLLLLDEPTANLDLRHQLQIMTLLAERAAQGAGVVTVLHDLNQAARWSNRIILMANGAVHADGTPEAVLTPENIQQVFGVTVSVTHDNETASLLVLPLEQVDAMLT